jgi:hypothetical protein
MTEEQNQQNPKEPTEPGPPPTPFDHPLFLPILLVAGVVWFGYDGWISADPDMAEHQTFNRYGFGLLLILSAWFGYKGWGEWQEDRAKAAALTSESSDEVSNPRD